MSLGFFMLILMIKIMCWNTQGTLGLDFNRYFRLLVSVQLPDMIAIFEPRISGDEADNFIRRSGFDYSYRVEANGFSGGIWVLWKEGIMFDVLTVSNQFVHGIGVDSRSNVQFHATFVYASPEWGKRRFLWDQLEVLDPGPEMSWLLGGDFNAIVSSDERSGGSTRRVGTCTQFSEFIFLTGLIDMGFSGPCFTWQRGNLSQRLDRFLCNAKWYDFFASSNVLHLPLMGSDHRPILLVTEADRNRNGQRPFRFVSAWNDHPDFKRLLHESWDSNINVFDSLFSFQEKSRQWNKDVFGHIGKKKRRLLTRIGGIERAIDRRHNLFLLDLEIKLKSELNVVLEQEESLWFQKSRSKWLDQGDRNTKFFHSTTLNRRRRNTIRMFRLDGGS